MVDLIRHHEIIPELSKLVRLNSSTLIKRPPSEVFFFIFISMLKIAFNKNYIYPLEENHRFPMIKYELIPEQLIRENTCTSDNFFKPKKLMII